MSCGPCDEKKKAEKKMSRGEFLGVGAAAALGTMAGCGPDPISAVAPAAAGVDSTTQDCQARDCHWQSRPLEWCIPAGILNSLWSDFFPRLVGITWHDINPSPPNDPQYLPASLTPLGPGVTSTDLVHLLIWLKTMMDFDQRPCINTPSSLKYRIKQVVEFFCLHQERTGKPFPIFVTATGGYDFLLSDWGIELFMPAHPKSQEDLLRYYSFRRTGRPSLGIPSYLTPSALALVSIDAPTGPSQIEMDPMVWAFTVGAICDLPHDLLAKFGITEARWDEIRTQAQEFMIHPPLLPTVEELRATDDWSRFLPPSGEQDGKDGQQIQRGETVPVNFEEYVCMMRAYRCWEVEGAVYRGFATELPRIVATTWMMEPTGGPQTNLFADPGDSGLRQLLRDRLETMLPRPDQMACQVSSSPLPGTANLLTHPADDRWNEKDLMITDHGFYFPELGGVPGLQDMYIEIAEGRAGNPVFTDSRRPDGEE